MTTDSYRLRDGSGFVGPVASGDRPLGVERARVRFIAPVSALSTGGVRPQAAAVTPIAMPQSVDKGEGLVGVRPWSPPV